MDVMENRLAGLRWLTLRGERFDVFRQLGRYAAEDIHAVQASMPEREGLQRWAQTAAGRRRLDELTAATSENHAIQLAELEAMADGAGIDFQDLLLANFRGDIGTHDGTGCTDLAWRKQRSVIAHNEDAAPALNGRLMFVSLEIDGDVPVTAQWYPGFVPANAFTANGNGLAWGINHVQVVQPPVAAGRHFVARALQQCSSTEAAIDYLRQHPTAGGFAYTMGDSTTGNVAVVEAAAAQVSVLQPGAGNHFAWHTNHLRQLSGEIDGGSAQARSSATQQLGLYSESVERGVALDRIEIPSGEPSLQWFVDKLTSQSLPDGVFRTAAGEDPLMTLCTVALDFTTLDVAVRGADGSSETLTLREFAGTASIPMV